VNKKMEINSRIHRHLCYGWLFNWDTPDKGSPKEVSKKEAIRQTLDGKGMQIKGMSQLSRQLLSF
jgi:hypothetical protein